MYFSRGLVSGSSTQELVAYLTGYQRPLGDEAIQQESHCLGACVALVSHLPTRTHRGYGAIGRLQRRSHLWTLMATSLSGFVAAPSSAKSKKALALEYLSMRYFASVEEEEDGRLRESSRILLG